MQHSISKLLHAYALFCTADFFNAEKEQVMEPIVVAKPEVDSAPIPVIGIEPLLESASLEIEGEDKLSSIAVLAY